MGQRVSRSGGGCLRAKLDGKWILEFYRQISKMQNHEIPYITATWGIVEDALELAPFLSVATHRNGKWTRIFAWIERQSLHNKKNTKFKA